MVTMPLSLTPKRSRNGRAAKFAAALVSYQPLTLEQLREALNGLAPNQAAELEAVIALIGFHEAPYVYSSAATQLYGLPAGLWHVNPHTLTATRIGEHSAGFPAMHIEEAFTECASNREEVRQELTGSLRVKSVHYVERTCYCPTAKVLDFSQPSEARFTTLSITRTRIK